MHPSSRAAEHRSTFSTSAPTSQSNPRCSSRQIRAATRPDWFSLGKSEGGGSGVLGDQGILSSGAGAIFWGGCVLEKGAAAPVLQGFPRKSQERRAERSGAGVVGRLGPASISWRETLGNDLFRIHAPHPRPRNAHPPSHELHQYKPVVHTLNLTTYIVVFARYGLKLLRITLLPVR